jgi:hypothetical protein
VEHSLDEGDNMLDEQDYPSDSLGSTLGSVTDEVQEEDYHVDVKTEPFDELRAAGEPPEQVQEGHDVVDVLVTDEPLVKDEPTEIVLIVDDLAQQSNEETHDPDLDLSVTSDSETMSVSEERVDEVKPRAHAGDDIEDMVNLLESVSISKVRPASVASIPDEVHEIPDEE